MKTFKQEWEDYVKRMYPQGISGVQAKETQQAFYAGALLYHNLQLELIEEACNVENQECKLMSDLHGEVYKFLEDKARVARHRN